MRLEFNHGSGCYRLATLIDELESEISFPHHLDLLLGSIHQGRGLLVSPVKEWIALLLGNGNGETNARQAYVETDTFRQTSVHSVSCIWQRPREVTRASAPLPRTPNQRAPAP